ncbi:MAG: biopolymer transporter ExbD [Paludibacteraceae bacterium]|nr:biopolymer transporter ExbD [Candidatus Physcocola equi]MCQ2234222.1 biopolymer transporter ExbD [Paludibacteraceae bacterium]
MKKEREVQEINASSMADISFLLLVFFLVTTTMATDEGLSRVLPPMKDPNQEQQKVDIKPRNIMEVLVNSNDKLMVNGEEMDVLQLKNEAKRFISTNGNDETLPEVEPVEIPELGGTFPVATAHVISLQNDRGTSYEKYIAVQNELVAAYDELRDAKAMEKFRKPYSELDEDKQKAIKTLYPQRLSEAEPKSYGGAK